jgi:hypothetical protein
MLSALTTACVPPSTPQPCEQPELRSNRGLVVEASIARQDPHGDDGPDGRSVCGDVEVTDRSTGWTWAGVTPAAFELSPGSYEVAVTWQDGGVTYRHDDIAVLGQRLHLTLPLCVDLTGMWRCEDGLEVWTTEVTMYDDCMFSLDGEPLTPHLSGHVIDGGRHSGPVAADGQSFTYLAYDTWQRQWTCERQE